MFKVLDEDWVLLFANSTPDPYGSLTNLPPHGVRMRIVLINQLEGYTSLFEDRMSERGFRVRSTEALETAGQVAIAEGAQAVVISMPITGSVVELVKSLRAQGFSNAIMVEQDQRNSPEAVELYMGGADEVVLKPLVPDLRAAKLQALIRRIDHHTTSEIQIGDLMFPLDGREVEVRGHAIKMTATERSLLECLALRTNRIQSRARILQHVYGEDGARMEAKVVDVYICKLRRRLKDAQAVEIRTVSGQGYMLTDSMALAAAS